ncbi:glutamate-5-semialdehyde dehydrogenase [Desulfospira joergensenii]|uniref:glutamate-5-semialdehyde dehydrogenase n=1 Tax=Desulfospira joergensenii TaxID=53329 RepID=UPI0003B4CACA|nr:glutamate-5-semialdehyde dehydrogenase [Desulfospira joergensenii]
MANQTLSGQSNPAVTGKTAAAAMSVLNTDVKDKALSMIIQALEKNRDKIFQANEADMDRAAQEGLEPALLKRLKFDGAKLRETLEGIQSLIRLEDPVGKTLSALELDKGLELFKISRPLGLIGVIFESRPDALVQIACLCLKSGNAVLMKGGSEAAETNKVLSRVIHDAGVEQGLPENWLGLLQTRDDVAGILKMDQYVDLIIPRGSNSFVRYIMENTLIPVLGHADGICHLYIDRDADTLMAIDLAVDGKCQYVAVCNAIETILVHESVAQTIMAPMGKALKAQKVKIFGCPRTCGLMDAEPASEQDWQTEYLDYVVSIRVVSSMDQALEHINRYGSGHTDVIVTKDRDRAIRFMDMADTADALWNCSSRFADGFRFGLGAEVGISTNKIHARGPVGLEGLMTTQFRLMGDGHRVADYSGDNARSFLHRPLDQKLDKKFQ